MYEYDARTGARCGVSSTKSAEDVVPCRPAARPRSRDTRTGKQSDRNLKVQVHCTMRESRITSRGRQTADTGAIKNGTEATTSRERLMVPATGGKN